MNATELRSKSVEELQAQIIELRKQQFKMRMQLATGDLSKNHQVAVARKDIARVKTVLTELARSAAA
ncbi:MAG: large subunit ribosomal protein L29 [Gammaproteobacteria bacterium]|jgi:large subunit ribosomal protein L29